MVRLLLVRTRYVFRLASDENKDVFRLPSGENRVHLDCFWGE